MSEWINVSDITPRIAYVATASQAAFTVPYVFFEDEDLKVYQNGTLLTLATNYTVAGAESETGGTVTLLTGATVGDTILITRHVPVEQTTHIPPSGPLDVPAINVQLSKLVAMIQQQADQTDRAIHFPDGDSTVSGELLSQASRANKLLGFGSAGEIIYPLGPTFVGTTSTGVAIVDSRATAQVTTFAVSVNVVVTEGLVTPGDGGGAEYVRGLVGDPGAFQDGGAVYWRSAILGVAEVESRATAALKQYPSTISIIRTHGYTTAGDGGGAVYKRGIISSPGAFQDAGGNYWGLDLGAGIVNPLWFGAKGDQTTNDAVALQVAATAAVAIGGELFFPCMFKTLTAISILGHVSVRGVGYQSSPIAYGFGATTNSYDTRATGFKAGGLICGVANGAFSVATTDSVSFQNLHITYPTAGNAGVSAFLLNSAAGDTGCNMHSVIRDVLINNAYIGITVNDWLQYEFDNIYFELNTLPIIAENTRSVNFSGVTHSASCGDSRITNCEFLITQGAAGIQLLSGSGYFITGNKFNGSNAGLPSAACILIAPQDLGYAFSMTPGIIANNSFEGYGIGISFAPNATSQGSLSLWSIVGNEFFCTVPIAMASGIAIPQWIGAVTISGNSFTYGQGGSSQSCIVIAGAGQVLVGDNVFAGAGGSNQPSVSIGLNTSNLKIGNNIYNGTGLGPPVLTPTLPASTVAVTNTTGYNVTVNVYGGTVGSVVVNLAGYGAATVSQVTNCSVVLNPNDQIVLTYSVGPAWIWRALNP